MLAVENLKAAYRKEIVLDLPAAEFHNGAITAVTGSNGAGKSTLLLALAGLITPIAGIIRYNSEEITGRCHRAIRIVLQRPVLFSGTVFDNVAYGLRCMGISKTDCRERVRDMLDRLNLMHLESRRRLELSGGELQRVALARVMVLEPEVILLDEPFTHLDEESISIMLNLLNELRGTKTIVFTTHSIETAAWISDEMLALDKGRPVRPPVTNILKGNSISEDSRFFLILEDGLRIEHATEVTGRTAFRIDPSAITLLKTVQESSSKNQIQGTILEIASEPPVVRVTVDCGVLISAVITMKSLHDMKLQVGETIYLSMKATSLRMVMIGN